MKQTAGLAILASCLFTLFLAPVAFGETAASLAKVPHFIRLDSLNLDQICGPDLAGVTKCYRGPNEPVLVPDGVGHLTSAFASGSVACGFDEDGLTCWELPTSGALYGGRTLADAYRNFFNLLRPESIQIERTNACGLDKKSQDLLCFFPLMSDPFENTYRIQPKEKITAYAVYEETVCWADGSAKSGKIECMIPDADPEWSQTMKMNDVHELIIIADSLCARSRNEAKCFRQDGTPTVLPSDAVHARRWRSDGTNLCILTDDHRFQCLTPSTGKIVPSGLDHIIPPAYEVANPSVVDIWTSMGVGCVQLEKGGVSCWNWWQGSEGLITFSQPILEMFGSGFEPCARLIDGQAECRMYVPLSRTLAARDRIRVELAAYNKCFWNSSGVDCRSRLDEISYRSVKVMTSARDETLCIIGVPNSDPANLDSVQCFGYDSDIRHPPNPLTNPTLVATNGTLACATSDEGLNCWGQPYLETVQPQNVMQASKLAMAERHGCVIDQFGLACWGELVALGLEIPPGLEQPGRVVDVAVGTSRTCAVLATGDVRCWGRDDEASGPPPAMKNAKSILGRVGLFCAVDDTGAHCWGGHTGLPK